MKPIYLLLILGILTPTFASSQNTFPATGNVGIGTNNSIVPLQLARTSNGLTDSSPMRNYHLGLFSTSLPLGEVGMFFTVYGSGDIMAESSPGAAITHQRIGNHSQGNLHFKTRQGTNASDPVITRMTISHNGNIGIGTPNPSFKLDIHSNNSVPGNIARFTDHHSNGVNKYAMIVSSNRLDYRVMGAASSTNLIISTSLSDGGSFRNGFGNIILSPAGNVAIGTTDPKGYKLAVNGSIRTKEVVVTADNWPDYVFHSTYNLRPLSEVKEHIATHGHLPEVPSAQQVEQDGIGLGEMNALLLKKVEELTLYSIEQERRIEELERQNLRIEELESLIKGVLNR